VGEAGRVGEGRLSEVSRRQALVVEGAADVTRLGAVDVAVDGVRVVDRAQAGLQVHLLAVTSVCF